MNWFIHNSFDPLRNIIMLSNKNWKLCMLLTAAASFMICCHVICALFCGYGLVSLKPSFIHFSRKFTRSSIVNNTSHITRVNNVVFTVKTSKRYHHNRLELVLKTWFQNVKKQVSRKMTTDYDLVSCTSKLWLETNLRFCRHWTDHCSLKNKFLQIMLSFGIIFIFESKRKCLKATTKVKSHCI